MDCPKCNTDMEIFDYEIDFSSYDTIYQMWKCKCPKCNYHGNFTKTFRLLDEEWEDEDEK